MRRFVFLTWKNDPEVSSASLLLGSSAGKPQKERGGQHVSAGEGQDDAAAPIHRVPKKGRPGGGEEAQFGE